MTSDDFDTWRFVYSQFVGADSKYGISYALNNVPGLRIAVKLEKIIVEIGFGNGPWLA